MLKYKVEFNVQLCNNYTLTMENLNNLFTGLNT